MTKESARKMLSFSLLFALLLALAYCGREEVVVEEDWFRPDLLVMEDLDGFPEHPRAPFYVDEIADSGRSFANGYYLTSLGLHTVGRGIMPYSTDGKFIAVGRVDTGTTAVTKNDLFLARFQPDGAFDTAFNGNGRVSTDFFAQGRGEVAHALATDSNGKILAVGRYNFGTPPKNYFIFAVARYTSNGVLDTSFGSTGAGTVVTNLNSLNAVARGVVVQGDNKVIVAGYNARVLDSNGAQPHTNYDMAIVRYNTNGTLDTTFNGTGILTISINSGIVNEAAYAVALERNTGKPILAGMARVNNDANFAVVRLNTNGSFDTSFNANGKRTIYINSGSAVINAVAIQTDNKILGAGYASNGNDYDFAIARLLTNGNLDTSGYNGVGWTVTNINGTREDMARAITLQDDGRAVLAGRYLSSFNNDDVALVRYNTNGSLDTSNFGTNGRVYTSIGTGEDSANGITFIPGGLLVTGRIASGSNLGMLIVRYNLDGSIAPSGSLDLSWGTGTLYSSGGGVFTSVYSATDRSDDAQLTTDGKLYSFGRANDGTDDSAVVVRYNTDGRLDTVFGTTLPGITAITLSGNDQFYFGTLQTDGKIVAVGTTNGNNTLIARFTTTGLLDTSFDGAGTSILNPGQQDRFQGVAIQTDGKLVAAGYGMANATRDIIVARYNTNGSLDTANWGTGNKGYVQTSIGTTVDEAYAIVLQTDGKAVTAGATDMPGGNSNIYVSRYRTNGTLDTTFNAVGYRIVSVGTGNDAAYSLALQGDGKILVGGIGTPGGAQSHLIVRFNTDGTLDSSFGSSGLVTSNPTGGLDDGRRIINLPDGKILLCGEENNQIGLMRVLTDGSFDTSFGGAGLVKLNPTNGNDDVFGCEVGPDGRIYTSGQSNPAGLNIDFGASRVWP